MGAFWKSLVEIWQGLSGGQKLTMLGTFALSIALVATVVWWSQKPQMSLLWKVTDTAEAAKICDHLRDQKVPYEVSDGGHSIYCATKQVYAMRMQLAAKGIPRGGTGGSVGFELFDKPAFGLSDFLQKANYYRALQGELARTISQMDEVESARVQIVPPNDRLFSTEKPEAKASVFLQLRTQSPLPKQQINAIRFLVANGVEGLKPGHVAIVDNNGHVLAEQTEEDSSIGMSASQLEVRRTVEKEYTTRLQSMLDQVVGVGQSVVRVNVDMNFDQVQQTDERFNPNEQVARSESTTTEDSSTPIRSAGGAAGTPTNTTGGTTNAVASAATETLTSTSKKSVTSNQYEISKTVQNIMKGMGDIKQVSVAVFINQQREGKGAEAKAKPRTDDEKKKLEDVLKQAVGYVTEGKGKRNDQFKLEEVPFTPLLTAEAEAEKKPTVSLMDRMGGLPWSSIIWQGLLFAAAIGLVLMFRNLLMGARSETLRTDLSIENLLASKEKPGLPGSTTEGTLTVNDLSKLIRENPTNTAQALKTWLSQT
jgi:flagellar M-ring protein FliF